MSAAVIATSIGDRKLASATSGSSPTTRVSDRSVDPSDPLGFRYSQRRDEYGVAPWFAETFIETERFRGTCYRAANHSDCTLIHIRQGKGRRWRSPLSYGDGTIADSSGAVFSGRRAGPSIVLPSCGQIPASKECRCRSSPDRRKTHVIVPSATLICENGHRLSAGDHKTGEILRSDDCT